MQTQSIDDLKLAIPKIAEQIPYLKLLILFGSRARGDHHIDSDWDFAVLYDEKMRKELIKDRAFGFMEAYGIIPDILEINSDCIDIVDLSACSLLIAHYVAYDGKLLYEREVGTFKSFYDKAFMSELELKNLKKELWAKVNISLQRRGYA